MLLSLTLSLLLAQSSPALGGLDPLELSLGDQVQGKESLEVTWGRHTYRFGGESTRDAFLAKPESWAIQWGGACARMGPLSDRGDPERYGVVGGKIYLFASDECRATFLKATERFLADVELGWPTGRAALAGGRNWIEKAATAHGSKVFDAKAALQLSRSSAANGWSQREELLIGKAGEVRRSKAHWKTAEGPAKAVETSWVLGAEPFTVEDGGVFDLLSAAEREDVLRYAHRQPLYLLWSRRQPGFRTAQFAPQEGDAYVRVAVEYQGLATELQLDPETAEVRGLYWLGRFGSGDLRDIEEEFVATSLAEGVRVVGERKIVVDLDEAGAHVQAWDELRLLDAIPAVALLRPK